MKIDSIVFSIKRFFHPDDYVSEKTRSKYEDFNNDPPIAPKFDEEKSKYRGKN